MLTSGESRKRRVLNVRKQGSPKFQVVVIVKPSPQLCGCAPGDGSGFGHVLSQRNQSGWYRKGGNAPRRVSALVLVFIRALSCKRNLKLTPFSAGSFDFNTSDKRDLSRLIDTHAICQSNPNTDSQDCRLQGTSTWWSTRYLANSSVNFKHN